MKARLFASLVLVGCPADDGMGSSETDASTGASTGASTSTSTSGMPTTSGPDESSSEEGGSSSGPMGEFDTRIQPIFDDRCTCHLTSVGSGGLSLQAGMAYENLVGVPSAGAPSLTRVVPGDADASYIIMKLEGTHLANGGVGSQMPLGSMLSQDLIDEIRAWIDEGAPE